MAGTVYIAIYAGLVIFVASCLARIRQYARLPLHLRWELYPLPHVEPRRAAHGGSSFELQHASSEPQRTNYFAEVRAMAEEILLLKSLRRANPRLWLPSMLFHGGLYLTIAAIALTVLAALAGRVAVCAPALAAGVGFTGAICVVAGVILLLLHRIRGAALHSTTRPGDIFNLLFFLAAFGLLAAGSLTPAPGTASLQAIARGALHFDRAVRIGGLIAAGLFLASALIAYIPFTHMAHFIGKYFAWHAVRWDNRRNQRGSAIEARVEANLLRKPAWAAAHIGADGRRSWAEIAASKPAPEQKP